MKDYFGYKDKICVVTGASSGMGEATVKMLVDLGAKVYAIDINECKVDWITKFIKCNLANKEEIDEAFKEIPNHIDAFFGVAGLFCALAKKMMNKSKNALNSGNE